MKTDLFLRRIGLDSLPADPLLRLQAVHRAFTAAVPFENLAILEGRIITLEPELLFTKVVENGRGGYCFELNGLLAAMLENLGMTVERLICRVWANGAPAPPLTHMALRVRLSGKSYLCDVGFGGGTLREPLLWETGKAAVQGPDCFRLDETDNGETMLSRLSGSDWKNQYSIMPCTMRAQDYIPANHYTSTHSDSFFTRIPVASLLTADGRITVHGRMFKRYGLNTESEDELSFDQLVDILSRDFGLKDLAVSAIGKRLAGLFPDQVESASAT